MKKLSIFISLLLIAGLSHAAFATNGMRMIGFGPVQRSMGGANIATPFDASIIITNPSGMSELNARVDFGASYFQPSSEYKATGVFYPAGSMGGGMPVVDIDSVRSDGKSFSSDVKASPIPALGIVLPINDQMRFGIGAYGIAGMGVDYADNLYWAPTLSNYSQMRFAPAVSYKVNDMFSAGVALNIMYATMSFDAGRGFGYEPHMTAASLGYGATIGVTVKPVKMLNVALAYETKSTFQDFEFNIKEHSVTDPITGGTANFAAGVDKLEFNQPDSLTGGVAVTPVNGLVVVLEVQWIRWSSTNGKNLPEYSSNVSGAQAWSLDWEDQLVYKIGISYDVMPVLVVRAGYNYGKMPLNADRAFENIAFPAVSEQHFTLGVGIKTGEKTTINIGGMYSPEASLSGSNPTQMITDYETKMSQYSLDFGVSYAF